MLRKALRVVSTVQLIKKRLGIDSPVPFTADRSSKEIGDEIMKLTPVQACALSPHDSSWRCPALEESLCKWGFLKRIWSEDPADFDAAQS